MYPRLPIAVLVLLGWIVSGTIHELGHAIAGKMAGLNFGIKAPGSDDGDIQRFMQHTGWPPPAVSAIALMLVVSCAAVLRWAWSWESRL